MPTEIAEVETLVAEVRTLMVGSRQVTMSVFNQLDECRTLIPFGRVRCKEPGLWLVGKHPDSGALVRRQIFRPHLPSTGGPDSWEHFLAHRNTRQSPVREEVAAGRRGDSLVWQSAGFYRCPDGTYGKCPADVQELQSDWEQVAAVRLEKYDAALDAYDAVNELPLIVLAGLR